MKYDTGNSILECLDMLLGAKVGVLRAITMKSTSAVQWRFNVSGDKK
jgi:hypothetical protein